METLTGEAYVGCGTKIYNLAAHFKNGQWQKMTSTYNMNGSEMHWRD